MLHTVVAGLIILDYKVNSEKNIQHFLGAKNFRETKIEINMFLMQPLELT